MSSSSSLVLTGRMMSANRQSFSSQGCWHKMNSMSGWRMAWMKLLPSFQQVIQRGRVGPDHVDLGAAVGRVLVVDELVLAVVRMLVLVAVPVARALEDEPWGSGSWG